jgi:two-component system, chemotaxis family, chemotaxis protein CheY
MAVRVLIADSSGITREIIRHHLECLGCEVIAEAENVSQTVDLFRTVRPEVVTLDMGLRPVGDSNVMSLFRLIRQESPGAAVIMVSANRAPENAQTFLREGALECVVEPFDTMGFEAMCRSLSSRYPELKPLAAAPAPFTLRGAGTGRRF